MPLRDLNILLLGFTVAITWASVCSAQNISFTSLASSQFTLFLRPTYQALNLEAVSTVQDAMSKVLLLAGKSNDSSFMTIGSFQVIPQAVEWQNGPASNSSLPTTSFRFVVVASSSVVATNKSDHLSPSELDSFIATTFASQQFEARFKKRLVTSGNSLLKDVVTVDVVASSAPPSKNQTSQPNETAKIFSKIDIVLLVVSGSIFLGVLYMIYRHHLDRGYIETQRMRFFSRTEPDLYMSPTSTSSFRGCHTADAVQYTDHNHHHHHHHHQHKPSSESENKPPYDVVVDVDDVSTVQKEPPSTPSTVGITAAAESPERPDHPPTPVSTPSPDQSHKYIHVGDAVETPVEPSSIHKRTGTIMSEVFATNWFKPHESLLSGQQQQGAGGGGGGEAVVSGHFLSSESDDVGDDVDEGDVFQADVAQMSPLSLESKDSSSSKPPRPAKRTLSDWMKGIRVVSSDKTSETTIHSLERSSTVEPSVAVSTSRSVNTSPNEPLSLEHSMAHSTVVMEQTQVEI